MPGFDHSVLTDVGWDALADALSNKKLNFIHFEAGDGTITGDPQMQGMTQLVHKVMDFPITSFSDDGQGQVTLIGTLTSTNAVNAFYFRELGIKATVDSGPELLYAVSNAGAQADYIPASTDTAVVIESMQIVVKIDRSVSFTVNVVPGGDVTAQNIGPSTAGAGLFRDKVSSILNFKRLISNSKTVSFTDVGTDQITADVVFPSFAPSGAIWEYGGLVTPAGWLFCNGALYNRSDYPDLSTVLGNRFGGDGTTTFAVPDFRGRVSMGAGLGVGLTSRAVGDKGGAEACTLTTAQIPQHNHTATQGTHAHTIADPTHAHTISDPHHNHSITNSGNGVTSTIIGQWDTNVQMNGSQQGYGRVNTGWPNAGNAVLQPAATGIGIYASGTGIGIYAASAGAITVANTGGGQAHSILNPYLVVNKIIKI